MFDKTAVPPFFVLHVRSPTLSDFLSSCEPPWCWTNTCRWRLCPGRGRELSRAWCVGCLGGATTVWVEARRPSRWGRSQCPLSQVQGVTAASPLTETSRQTWSVPATGLEEKMHARYSLQLILNSFSCEVSGRCTLMARWDKHDHLIFEKPLNPFWNDKFSEVLALVPSVYQIARGHPLFISETITLGSSSHWHYEDTSSSCQCWFSYKLLLSRRGSALSGIVLLMIVAEEIEKQAWNSIRTEKLAVILKYNHL